MDEIISKNFVKLFIILSLFFILLYGFLHYTALE